MHSSIAYNIKNSLWGKKPNQNQKTPSTLQVISDTQWLPFSALFRNWIMLLACLICFFPDFPENQIRLRSLRVGTPNQQYPEFSSSHIFV